MNHRTALITAALVAAVVFGGVAAIGANLGILNAADASSIGQLSATAAEGELSSSSAGDEAAAGYATEAQTFLVDKAGSVSVLNDESHAWVTDVSPRKGWKYRLVQTSDRRVVVTFERGKRTLRFSAKLGPGGAIKARVDEPVTKVVVVPGSSGASSGGATTVRQVTQPASSDPVGREDNGGDDDHEEEHEGEDDDD